VHQIEQNAGIFVCTSSLVHQSRCKGVYFFLTELPWNCPNWGGRLTIVINFTVISAFQLSRRNTAALYMRLG